MKTNQFSHRIFVNIVGRFLHNDSALKSVPLDMDVGFRTIFDSTKIFTMTSAERMYSMYKAVEYITKARIHGDMVECGVWKGGSSMIAALTLIKAHDTKRKIYLYDTYAGMSEPSKLDTIVGSNKSVHAEWSRNNARKINLWCYSPLEEVKMNLYSTGYPKNKLLFIQGEVEKTIPAIVPRKISLLRLDTDWYKSTYHELEHLFPLLVPGGVLIIDDYGHWSGARKAADKYFKKRSVRMLLNRIDYTGRIGIKL